MYTYFTNVFFARFEVFTAATMNVVFWDVAPCRPWVNRRFGETYRLHLLGRKIRERGASVSRWLQTEPPVGNNQLYKNREGGSVAHMRNQQTEGYSLGEGQQAGRNTRSPFLAP
jgi:hypothetical protein